MKKCLSPLNLIISISSGFFVNYVLFKIFEKNCYNEIVFINLASIFTFFIFSLISLTDIPE